MLQVSTPGPLPELTSLTTGDYLESWLSQVRGRVRGRTYSGYAGLLRRYAIPLLGEVPLKDLHPLHLQHLYGQLLEQGAGGYRDQLSASTVLNLHRVLVQSLGWAERFGLLERSPAKAARPPRPRRAEPKVVDPALAERILEASRIRSARAGSTTLGSALRGLGGRAALAGLRSSRPNRSAQPSDCTRTRCRFSTVDADS